MTADAASKKLDSAASKIVQKVATTEGAFHGFVPPETIAFFYQHANLLAAEIVKPLLGFQPPEIALSIDRENRKQLGHFKIGRDGLGLNWRISLNVLHLARPKAEVIGTLLHEILHAVQQAHGKPGKGNFHNKEFIAWCAKLGLPTDSRGHDLGIDPKGVYADYVKRHKLDGKVALVPKTDLPKPGGSKLKKWTCSCGVNVRVAIEDFEATCDKCETAFVKKDK